MFPIFVTSVMYALAKCTIFFSYAAAFYVGVLLILDGKVEMLSMFRVFAVMTFSAQMLGEHVLMIPEMKKAILCSKKTLRTLKRKTLIPEDEGLKPESEFRGQVEFRNVYFRYPTRPTIPVLRVRKSNFSFIILLFLPLETRIYYLGKAMNTKMVWPFVWS
ncbi:unnamed protein product [Protopolystoma xenopodis]|uniref:ABC transmembrane type-1 domain-containing protein n=1 Tax=Protopolystoma xenopodis TaxID=117903 RepID=A0A3S5AL48_9PLAT|nr:unnamed protein product [Protopolystoma xenopodis]